MQQGSGGGRGDALGCTDFGCDRLPRINAPQFPALAVLDRNLAAAVEFRDRRQPPGARDVLRSRGLADRVDHRAVTQVFEHTFDTRWTL